MSSTTTHGKTPYYFIPGPSRHPVLAALGLFFVILGASQWINGAEWGKYSLMVGLAWWLGVLYQWFSQSISESEGEQCGKGRDQSGERFVGTFFHRGVNSLDWWKLRSYNRVSTRELRSVYAEVARRTI